MQQKKKKKEVGIIFTSVLFSSQIHSLVQQATGAGLHFGEQLSASQLAMPDRVLSFFGENHEEYREKRRPYDKE